MWRGRAWGLGPGRAHGDVVQQGDLRLRAEGEVLHHHDHAVVSCPRARLEGPWLRIEVFKILETCCGPKPNE